jgi:hypothetical protein
MRTFRRHDDCFDHPIDNGWHDASYAMHPFWWNSAAAAAVTTTIGTGGISSSSINIIVCSRVCRRSILVISIICGRSMMGTKAGWIPSCKGRKVQGGVSE